MTVPTYTQYIDFSVPQSPSYLIGVDVGTGGSRAILIDTDGAIVASATTEHQPFRSASPGWADQDPEDWWQASASSIRQVLSASGAAPEQIAAVAFAGQMHGAVLLDDRDQVLRPALIWCDQRTQRQSDWLEATVGRERIIALTANPALTNFTLTKLLWVRENEPELFQRFRRFLLPKDFVRLRLTGEHAMDVAEASGTLLLDVTNRRWSEEMFAACGMPLSCAPRLFESCEVCARVNEAGAAATGLRPGTPVVAGAGDQAAGAVGMGVVRPGTVSATIGTSGVVFAATDRPAADSLGRLHTFCHAVPDRWHVMGVTQAAGLSLRWLRDTLSPAQEYGALMDEAELSHPGSGELLWLPYLMGERTPHLDPEARGALIGMHAGSTRADVVRAVLEGVAFSLRDTLEIFAGMRVPVERIRLAGGGARAPLWRQIQADVYGQEVETVQTEEGAAYGAALLAGVGVKVWKGVEEACDTVVRTAARVEPNADAVSKLNSQYQIYRSLYPALKQTFHHLSAREEKFSV